MSKILIGAPIYDRDWIISHWFDAIKNQNGFTLSDIGFIFEAAPNDDKTHELLFDWHSKHPQVACFDVSINTTQRHTKHRNDHRGWTKDRYHDMVAFRNNLLDRAIAYGFDRYFSLDTDILLEDKSTLEQLYEFTVEPVAASPLMFMSKNSRQHPSTMTWSNGPDSPARRLQYPLGERFKTDVIMAAKMMSKPIYQNVRYVWHPQGEDLGWSSNCAKQGYSLYCLSDIYAPHIMGRDMLKRYLVTGDSRKIKKKIDKNL